MSSCSVTENRCAIRPANAGGSVFQESCNAGAAGASALSPRMAHSSIESGTCRIKESCNARGARCRPRPYPGWAARQACTRTACKPGLHANGVQGVPEVPDVVGAGQPKGLTGGLAGAPACAGRAVPLTLAVAMVEVEKQPTTQALALSRLRHRRSPTGSSGTAPSATRHARRPSLKKTDINPEEDPSRTSIRRRPKTKKRHVQTGRRKADSDRRP